MSLKEVLSKIPILSALTEEDLHRVEASLIRRSYSKGQIVFNRGDKGGTLYVIRTGKVKVYIRSHERRELILANLSPGDILGELSFIDGKTRSATAEAVENTELLCLLREDFLALLRNRFDLVLQVMEVLAQRLRDTDSLLAETKTRNLSSWLIRKILDLSRLFGMAKKRP